MGRDRLFTVLRESQMLVSRREASFYHDELKTPVLQSIEPGERLQLDRPEQLMGKVTSRVYKVSEGICFKPGIRRVLT